ncbi:hypothetical protein BKA65DRAFT_250909 [Rhexocercosporidium sp. MPI-PUGE-AT-0058]|nr:hypothetical protein BKA65DRAFT_250909 [Rhexocercosporidium sp. MPI-PUGE-AT-0058]
MQSQLCCPISVHQGGHLNTPPTRVASSFLTSPAARRVRAESRGPIYPPMCRFLPLGFLFSYPSFVRIRHFLTSHDLQPYRVPRCLEFETGYSHIFKHPRCTARFSTLPPLHSHGSPFWKRGRAASIGEIDESSHEVLFLLLQDAERHPMQILQDLGRDMRFGICISNRFFDIQPGSPLFGSIRAVSFSCLRGLMPRDMSLST